MNRTIGIVLLVAGSHADPDRLYVHKKEKVVDTGPIPISADKKAVKWPLYAGGILLIEGIILIAIGKKTS